MATQVTKRCHWVPQAYLKAFAADDKGRRIWRLSKNVGEPECKRIEKVAVKYHLYAPMAADGRRDDGLERKLADLETFFGTPAWSAICNDFPDFSSAPLRKIVALLTAVTWLRTPLQFELWKSTHQQFVALLSQHDRPPDFVSINNRHVKFARSSWPIFRDATEEDLKWAWNTWIGQAADIADILYRMRWAIIYSKNPAFVTSDNPVLVGDTLGPHKGLAHLDAMVSFPLSPTRILRMDNRHDEPDAIFYPLKDDPAVANVLIWRNAIEYIFSPRHPDEVCAEMLVDAERNGFA